MRLICWNGQYALKILPLRVRNPASAVLPAQNAATSTASLALPAAGHWRPLRSHLAVCLGLLAAQHLAEIELLQPDDEKIRFRTGDQKRSKKCV